LASAKPKSRLRAAGGAATFLLAAVAGVVGVQVTGHLTLALVIFAVLVLAGAAITYRLERRSGERDGDNQGGRQGGRYDLRGAQGVQIGGTHNEQTNDFGDGQEKDSQG
jgi:membrane protein implicated in regulation of membrane protease activity